MKSHQLLNSENCWRVDITNHKTSPFNSHFYIAQVPLLTYCIGAHPNVTIRCTIFSVHSEADE